MKGKIIFFLFLISTMAFAQKTEGIIHFNDGTQKQGYIKYGPGPFTSDIYVTDKVKYRKIKKSKEVIEYNYSDILKIDLTKDGEIQWTYFFKILEKNSNIILQVQELQKGKVSLYTHLPSYSSVNEYYVQNGENNIVKIFPGKPFGVSSEKLMKQFFEDCPSLVKLIEKEAFKKYVANTPELADKKSVNRLIEIVKYYNSKCVLGN